MSDRTIEYRCPSCGEMTFTVINNAVIRCKCGAFMMQISPEQYYENS